MASPRRIVVVSPHLDDGVLSLGAAMASWARGGARVELLTVLACDPHSEAPAGGWDARGGFATEAESARARRAEDKRACAILGIEPVWLPFGSVDYERHGTEDDVLAAVSDAVRGADVLLVPGFPLTHPDHAWLSKILADRVGLSARAGRYAELLYVVREATEVPHDFRPVRTTVRDRLAKWRATRRYRSQLPLLGMTRKPARSPAALAIRPERVAWSGDSNGRPL